MPFLREPPKLSDYDPEELQLAEKLWGYYSEGNAKQFLFLKKWNDITERERIAWCEVAVGVLRIKPNQ